MHRLRAAETGDIEAMTDLLLRHGPNPWNHLPEEGVRAHLRAIADGEVRAVLAERDDRLLDGSGRSTVCHRNLSLQRRAVR